MQTRRRHKSDGSLKGFEVDSTRQITARCHGGAVEVTIPDRPDYINDCNCSLCRKSGGIWGYFHPASVDIKGETEHYQRPDISQPAVQVHLCSSCDSTTHWELTEHYVEEVGANERMGVNMRLFDKGDLIGVELRFPDGKAWNGTDEFNYRRKPQIIGKTD